MIRRINARLLNRQAFVNRILTGPTPKVSPARRRRMEDAELTRVLNNESRREDAISQRAANDQTDNAAGYAENEIMGALRQIGFRPKSQVACGEYNIEVAVGSIAVEAFTEWQFRPASAAFLERTGYITDAGYCIVFVVGGPADIIGNLDRIASFVSDVYLDPSAWTENWMIWCRSERRPKIRNIRGRLTSVPVPMHFFNVIRAV